MDNSIPTKQQLADDVIRLRKLLRELAECMPLRSGDVVIPGYLMNKVREEI